jgi:hypothetical protein
MIVVSFIVLFLGVFPTSTVALTSQAIKIRKHYFWALFEWRRDLLFDQVISIRTKEYAIETHEDAGLFTESIFSFLTIYFFKPKIHWATTKLLYVDHGVEKSIELKITRNDYRDIEKEIRQRHISWRGALKGSEGLIQ